MNINAIFINNLMIGKHGCVLNECKSLFLFYCFLKPGFLKTIMLSNRTNFGLWKYRLTMHVFHYKVDKFIRVAKQYLLTYFKIIWITIISFYHIYAICNTAFIELMYRKFKMFDTVYNTQSRILPHFQQFIKHTYLTSFWTVWQISHLFCSMHWK